MSLAGWVCLAMLAGAIETPVDFDTEIIPILTKAGCNAGACHGAAAGRGGFRLSLLGADPTADFESIVHSFEGRRVNLVNPKSSLILLKPTGQLEHGGDVVLEDGNPETERLINWIRAGAPRGQRRQLTRFEVTPRRQLCETTPVHVALKARAQFDNGPWEDVTSTTAFTSSDPFAVQIEEDDQALVTRHGQHTVIARFLNQVVPVQLNVPFSSHVVDLSAEPRASFIDDQILSVLSELRVPVSPAASDVVWLRRVSLDLSGRLPEPEQVDAFLADQRPERRTHWVDALLNSDAFADYWTLQFARLLRLHSLPNDQASLEAYSAWLRREIAGGTRLDELARQLLTTDGDSHMVGPANFGRMVGDARSHAELVGQVFLGVRLGCANCHNHPLDKWTQDDYHGLSAIFARLDRGRHVRFTTRGAVTNLRTNQPAIPRIPGVRDLPVDGDHRQVVLEWVTSVEQNYFARATVNRLWKAMFGRGLIEPVDDLRETNPATHPELLELLTQDFVDNGYSIRRTLKLIALSQTYARSGAIVPGNELDDRLYSRAFRRPLAPEVVVDAITDVTGVPNDFGGQVGRRAVAMIDPLSPAPELDILGRCNRAMGCEDGTSRVPGLTAQLHLLNGDLINRKLVHDDGRLHRLISQGQSDSQIVTEFYMRGLGRQPTEEELQGWIKRLQVEDSRERCQRLEDFVWGLLNSRDFLENH
jgi:hypothetical protein